MPFKINIQWLLVSLFRFSAIVHFHNQVKMGRGGCNKKVEKSTTVVEEIDSGNGKPRRTTVTTTVTTECECKKYVGFVGSHCSCGHRYGEHEA